MAISTMKIEASVKEKFKTEIECSNPFVIDQPVMAGGENAGPNPLEVFLSSLGGCICAIGRIISNQRRLNVRGITAVVEGDIDKNVLMGITKEGRSGFVELRSFVTIDADLTNEEKDSLLQEIASRCPVADNIKFESKLVASMVENKFAESMVN